LSHKTEWIEQEEDVYIGMGQRMLASDEGEYPLLDVRLLRLGEESERSVEHLPTESP